MRHKNDNEDIENEISDMQLWPDFNSEMQNSIYLGIIVQKIVISHIFIHYHYLNVARIIPVSMQSSASNSHTPFCRCCPLF